MNRSLLVLSCVVLLGGCKRPTPSSTTETTSASGPKGFDAFDPNVGDSVAQPNNEGARQVTFRIVAVHEHRSPRPTAPFHVAGGTWTFFDAVTSDGIPFGFGFAAPSAATQSFHFGEVMLTAPDSTAGGRLAARFAKTFEAPVPTTKTAQPLSIRPIQAAFLAVNASRSGGGFKGDGKGGYYATKLFLQRDGLEAEVFFNFNLQARVGEFSEKDADYAKDMVAFLAAELRDGPRPVRTAATDPNIVDAGPRFEWFRTLAGRFDGWSPAKDRIWMVESVAGGGERLLSIGLEGEDDRIELAKVEHRFGSMTCASDTCVVTESKAMREGVWSGDDPSWVSVASPSRKTQKRVAGPWGDRARFLASYLSPDGAFFLVLSSKTKALPRTEEVYVVRPDGSFRPVDLPNDGLSVLAVERNRIVVRTYGKDKSTYAIDPATLKVTPTSAPPPAEDEDAATRPSPDGQRTVRCDDSQVIVEDVRTKVAKTFPIHEDDRPSLKGCVRWASPRFLEYHGRTEGFLDTTTMKLSPFSDTFAKNFTTETTTNGRRQYSYDKTFRYVAMPEKQGARLGRVKLP